MRKLPRGHRALWMHSLAREKVLRSHALINLVRTSWIGNGKRKIQSKTEDYFKMLLLLMIVIIAFGSQIKPINPSH